MQPFNLMAIFALWHTGTTMWLKLWERMHGYDKWTEAEATVHAPDPHNFPGAASAKDSEWDGDILVWTDHQGHRHSADFIVPDDCTLYQKVNGDTLHIRYNPRKPAQFYQRQLHRVHVRTVLKRVLITASIIGLVVMALRVRSKP